MKRLLSALLTALFFASPAFALVGGPWDANVPGNPNPVNPSNADGAFQGTIKGQNLAGIIRFGTSTSAQIATPGFWTYTVTGTGTNQVITEVYTPGTSAGAASIFYGGGISLANVDATIDLGARQIAGVIDGASTRAAILMVTAPLKASPNHWTVTNNISFSGEFTAKLCKNLAQNSFSGTGTLSITAFDLAGFNADAATSATADPSNHIVTTPVSIKVSGVRTSNVFKLSSLSVPNSQSPAISVPF
ncbi:MAG: hypothetical protein NTZ46_01610 [Verrucomicrobia bacterium]|nr:hypothetical protein [Verrucomicrobiota bacterium]